MHELGMLAEVVDALSRRAGGSRVRAATVRVGGHALDPSVTLSQLELVAAGTAVEGAEVRLVVEPLAVRCLSCGACRPVEHATDLVACRSCGDLEMEPVAPEGCVIETIELVDCDRNDCRGRGM